MKFIVGNVFYWMKAMKLERAPKTHIFKEMIVGKRSIPQVLCVMGNNSVQRRNVIHFLKCNTSNNNRQILFGALLKCPPPTKTKTIYSHLSPRVEMLTEKDACFQASLYNFSTSHVFLCWKSPAFHPTPVLPTPDEKLMLYKFGN